MIANLLFVASFFTLLYGIGRLFTAYINRIDTFPHAPYEALDDVQVNLLSCGHPLTNLSYSAANEPVRAECSQCRTIDLVDLEGNTYPAHFEREYEKAIRKFEALELKSGIPKDAISVQYQGEHVKSFKTKDYEVDYNLCKPGEHEWKVLSWFGKSVPMPTMPLCRKCGAEWVGRNMEVRDDVYR